MKLLKNWRLTSVERKRILLIGKSFCFTDLQIETVYLENKKRLSKITPSCLNEELQQ